MRNAMQGNTFTHNHPSGGPLGFSDIDTALRYGAAEFRAVGPEQTRVLDLTGLPTESRGSAVTALAQIKNSLYTEFKAAHPNFENYSAAEKFQVSSQILESMVQQLAERFPNQIRHTVIPTTR